VCGYTVTFTVNYLLCRLKKCGLKVKFVTNTTKEPLRTLHERLTYLGFNIDKSEIFTSLSAASAVVRRKNLRPLLFLEDIAKEDFAGKYTFMYNDIYIHLSHTWRKSLSAIG
jgi:ribonucleotide monophosphatase NagD (HAD superfamily)